MTSDGAGAAARRTVALCFAIAVLEGFDIQAIGVAAPRVLPELGLSPSQMGWVFSFNNVGMVLGALAGGWFADQVGRKRVLVMATLTFAIFTLAVVLANQFATLFAARLCAGIGFGAAMPNLMALSAEISPSDRRSTTAALMFCGMPLGGGTAALVTQLLPVGYDWRWLFVIGGVLPLLVTIAVLAWLVETWDASRHSARRVPVAAVLFGGGRAVPTLLIWLTFFSATLILYLILNWLPLLVASKGIDRAAAPQAALAFNYASVVGSIVIGRLVDRLGPRWPLSLAFGGLVVSLIVLASATELRIVISSSAAAGFFVLGASYALYGVAAGYYPTVVRGTGSGAAFGVGRVGSIAGPLLAGWLLSGGATSYVVIMYMAPVAVVAALAVFLLSFHTIEN